ncbi:MAG: MobA/MobL family protein [Chloroflexota bacterium]
MKWSRNKHRKAPSKKPVAKRFTLRRKARSPVDAQLEKAAQTLLKGSNTLMKWRQDPRIAGLGMVLWGAGQLLSSDERADIEHQLDEEFHSGLAISLWEKAEPDYPHFDLNTATTMAARDGRIPVRNLIEAIAYQTGSNLQDEQQGHVYDFRDRGDIRFSKLLSTEWSADWVKAEDTERLWNSYLKEMADAPADTALANHLRLPLPYDLSLAQKQALVENFIDATFIDVGAIAQYSLIDHQAEYGIVSDVASIIVPVRRLNQHGDWSSFAVSQWLPQDSHTGIRYHNPDWEAAWFDHVDRFISQYGTHEQRERHAERMAIEPSETEPYRDTLTKDDSDHLTIWDVPAKQLERHQDSDAHPHIPNSYQMELVGAGDTSRDSQFIEMLAYQQGISLSPNYGKQIFDFSDRGDVILRGLHIPDASPDWLRTDGDQEKLWASLGQVDSEDQPLLASVTIPLPQAEPEALQKLVDDYLEDAFTERGFIAAYAIHLDYSAEGDYAPHVHIFTPLHTLNADGQWTSTISPFFQQPARAAETLQQIWQDHTEELRWEYEPLSDELSLPQEMIGMPDWFNQQVISLRPLHEIPDNRSTWGETEDSYFEEGSFNTDDATEISGTLLPPYAPDFVEEAWRALLGSRIEEEKIILDTPLVSLHQIPETILASHQWIVPLPEDATLQQQHQLMQDYAHEFTERGLLFHYVLHPQHETIAQMHPLLIEGIGVENDTAYLFEAEAETLSHAHITVPIFEIGVNGRFGEKHPAWDEPDLSLEWQRDWHTHYLEYQMQQEELEQDEHQASLTTSQELMREIVLNLPEQDAFWHEMENDRLAELAYEQELERDHEWSRDQDDE